MEGRRNPTISGEAETQVQAACQPRAPASPSSPTLNRCHPSSCWFFPYVSVLSRYSRVWLFATLWTVACQAPLTLGFSRQEHWSGLPMPSRGPSPQQGSSPSLYVSYIGRCVLYHWCHLGSPLPLREKHKQTNTYPQKIKTTFNLVLQKVICTLRIAFPWPITIWIFVIVFLVFVTCI